MQQLSDVYFFFRKKKPFFCVLSCVSIPKNSSAEKRELRMNNQNPVLDNQNQNQNNNIVVLCICGFCFKASTNGIICECGQMYYCDASCQTTHIAIHERRCYGTTATHEMMVTKIKDTKRYLEGYSDLYQAQHGPGVLLWNMDESKLKYLSRETLERRGPPIALACLDECTKQTTASYFPIACLYRGASNVYAIVKS
jgi:hypothetical protein